MNANGAHTNSFPQGWDEIHAGIPGDLADGVHISPGDPQVIRSHRWSCSQVLHTVVTRGRGHRRAASVASRRPRECQTVGVDMGGLDGGGRCL